MTWDDVHDTAAETAKLVVSIRFKARALDWRHLAIIDRKVRPIVDLLAALTDIVPVLAPDGTRAGNPANLHIAARLANNAYERAAALVTTE